MNPSDIMAVRRALVVAPHPDDESLGCGGLLAGLAQRRCEVFVIFVTDGGASHLRSRKWPRERLASQRRAEANAALLELGLGEARRAFFNFKDADMPISGSLEWRGGVVNMRDIVTRLRPELIVAPWRRDPHCDHRGSWQMMRESLGRSLRPPTLEYAVWLDELGSAEDHPQTCEAKRVSIDIRSFLPAKRRAIAAHSTQTTALIDDDPKGFRLTPHTIDRLTGPVEYYWRGRDGPN